MSCPNPRNPNAKNSADRLRNADHESGRFGLFFVAGVAAVGAVIHHHRGQVVVDANRPGWSPLEIYHDQQAPSYRMQGLARLTAFMIFNGGEVTHEEMDAYMNSEPSRADRRTAKWALQTLQRHGVGLIGAMPDAYVAQPIMMTPTVFSPGDFPQIATEIENMRQAAAIVISEA